MYPGGETPTHNESAVGLGTFLAVMGKVISTVRVVTTDEPGGRFALTVSSMSSVTIEPPSMLVCIHGGSPVVAAVERNRTLCVNRLGEGQVHISEAERTMLVTGCPVPLSAAASHDCKIAGQQAATHMCYSPERSWRR
jgi:flavin reductase